MDEEHLQIENRISRLEERFTDMDKSTSILSALFERSMEVQEKSAQAMERISATMVEVKISMGAMQNEICELHKRLSEEQLMRKEEFSRVEGKISGVAKTVKELDETSKINWQAIIKNSFVLLGGSALFGLTQLILTKIVIK